MNNCSNNTIVSELKRASLIGVVFSGASLLLLVLLLAVLVLHRAYRTSLQRLLLYLITAAILSNVVITLNIQLQFDVHSKFCEWVGFFDVWTTNLLDLLSLSFTVYLIVTAYQEFNGKRLQCMWCCRRHPVLTEILFLIVVTLLPLIYLLKPVLRHSFGLGVFACWVKTLDENCTELVNHEVMVTVDVVDLVLRLANILSLLALIVVVCMPVTKLRRNRVETVGRAVFLVLMIILSRSITVAFFVLDMIPNLADKLPLYPAVSISGCILSNLFVILGVTAYLYSPRKLSIKSLRRAARKWTCCERFKHHGKRRVNTKPSGITDDHELASVEISVEQDIPSYTIALTAPYTNGFTDVTEIMNSHRTTKYGTTMNAH
jgi:hypothetical protein